MPPQIKQDLNRSGWETTDFPSVCEKCLPDNPYVQMLKEDHGAVSLPPTHWAHVHSVGWMLQSWLDCRFEDIQLSEGAAILRHIIY
jgi:hypothetical protein